MDCDIQVTETVRRKLMNYLDEGRVFTEPEAARLLKMTTRMLANRRRDGKIRCLKDGHFITYTVAHIAEYLSSLERGLDQHMSATRLLEAVQEHLARSDRMKRHSR